MNVKPIFIIITFFILLVSCKQTNEQLLDKAFELTKQNKYNKAIEVYTKVIKSNSKLQLAYYNRGISYVAIKDYPKAYADFNKVMALQTKGGFIFTYNQDSSFADEEAKAQIPYNDALYHRAQVKFYMDSIKSSFEDFQTLIARNYEEISNCLLWQGTICIQSGMTEKACECFDKAKKIALIDNDREEADKMIATYCGQTNHH